MRLKRNAHANLRHDASISHTHIMSIKVAIAWGIWYCAWALSIIGS